MSITAWLIAAAGVLFVALPVAPELGRRIAVRRGFGEPGTGDGGSGVVTGALFALLGLLTAFTFTGAFSRLDARRQIIVDEANAIGTAYLRLDLLAEPDRRELRELFARYTASRAALFDILVDHPAAYAELDRAAALGNEIWTRSVAACRDAEEPACAVLLLPALNEMLDIVTTRTTAILTHPPPVIFATLVGLALLCAAYTGYQGGPGLRRSHTVGFAAATTFVFSVIYDVEYPRIGIVRLDAVNQLLVDLAESMR